MKRVLLAVATLLALVTAQPAIAQPMPVYNWSGFYLGGTAGGLWGNDTLSTPAFTGERNPFSGFLGGPTIGFNWQTGSWVFGLEGDYSWFNWEGDVSFGCIPACREKLTSFGTIRARVGHATDNLLIYATAGAAFTRIENWQTTISNVSGADVVGWTIGAGLEGALSRNWSWKVEYLYANFQPNITFFTANVRHDLNESVLRAGINFRFGTGQ